jgi:internalin A
MELEKIRDLITKAKESNATKLDLSSKGLTSLPSEIKELKNLTTLYISSNQLTSLPPEIAELKKLTELYISANQLTSLPSEIAKLKNLTELSISGNQLTSLPPEIAELKNLTELSISVNQLTSLPPEIAKLKNLTRFNISVNKLTSLPSEIAKLKNLKLLVISKNQLTSLPPEIAELKKLTELYIDNNQLTSLPSEIAKLKNLKLLAISKNQLTSLPPEILELDLDIKWKYQLGKNEIILEGNPLENPPIEIVKKGREAIINYFKSLEDGKEPLNEVKVLLVGDGEAGKTSLVKRLLGEGFDGNEHQTQGINIKKWEFKDKDKEIKVNFWDFGGQEIMHATHQFFLSKRSLYILVLDSRRDEKAEYWLKHIRSFGGDSPVLIALNKIDENPSFELNRKFLQEKYPSIKGFFRISCKKNRGIAVFSIKLKEEILKVENMQIEWAKSWFEVKTKLEKMSCNFITYEEYRNICLEENLDDKSSQNTLVDFLNDLGVIVHFKDISLLDTHVLEPKWITEGVYKIINSEILAKEKGVLRLSMLDEILEQKKEGDYYYPPERYGYIINLMKKFELCYSIDNETVLLPDLLAVSEPEFDFDSNESLKFFIEYDFLPRSIMPRFTVKMNKDIKNGLQWRTGVVLKNKQFNSCAVIRSDNEAKRIYINVNGSQRRDYFSSILFNLREINSNFEKLKAVEKIPLPDEPEIAVRYDHLVYLEEIGEDRYRPEGSRKAYNVKDLLGTVNIKRTEQELLEEILSILKNMNQNEEEKFENIVSVLSNLAMNQAEESDDCETLSRKLNKIIMLQPNWNGFGLNINEAIDLAIDRYFKWKRKRK